MYVNISIIISFIQLH